MSYPTTTKIEIRKRKQYFLNTTQLITAIKPILSSVQNQKKILC